MLCLLASSTCLSYIILRIDYAGLAALISTSFYPHVYYSFICSQWLRASLFFGMGISGVAPIIHKLILYRNQKEALQTTCYEVLMGVFYGLGALVYAARIPERWRPGKFDIAGHSHQLFHVLVVAGAYTHYCAGLVYLQWRDLQGC
ncbi:ADIPOR-like receptor [Morus notabilis]|uniref:ADIPOR-like receptor n=1 Tax=Morus notabilis TaxID=981085 RepID=W9S6J3_9ROSA|nr:ADIPOR-like receptor [Morus notabilis]